MNLFRRWRRATVGAAALTLGLLLLAAPAWVTQSEVARAQTVPPPTADTTPTDEGETLPTATRPGETLPATATATQTPTPTSTPTDPVTPTPQPTSPLPTPTPQVTATSTATARPQPTATPTPVLLPSIPVTFNRSGVRAGELLIAALDLSMLPEEVVDVVITVPFYTTFDAGASSAGWRCENSSAPGTPCLLPVKDELVAAAIPQAVTLFGLDVDDVLPSFATEITVVIATLDADRRVVFIQRFSIPVISD